jgi:hypothetical protein
MVREDTPHRPPAVAMILVTPALRMVIITPPVVGSGAMSTSEGSDALQVTALALMPVRPPPAP